MGVLYNSRMLGLSLKLGPRCLDRVLNSVKSPVIFKYTQTL
jgi:hypothetical protein